MSGRTLAGALLCSRGVRALGAVVALALGPGCLLGYPDDTEPLPPLRNRPPRIEERNVVPAERIVSLEPEAGECRQEFSLRVADPDVGDHLVVRWFVDFSSNPARPVYFLPDTNVPASDSEVRDSSARLVLDTRAAGSPIAQEGSHVLEAWVSDGILQVVEENGQRVVRALPRELDADGGVLDPSYTVSYAWVIETATGCPQAGALP